MKSTVCDRRSLILAAACLATPLLVSAPAALVSGAPATETASPACAAGQPVDSRPPSLGGARRKSALALDWLGRIARDPTVHTGFSPFGISQVLTALEIGADPAMKAAIANALKFSRRQRGAALQGLRADARLLATIAGRPTAPFASADGLFIDQALKLAPGVEDLVQSEAGIAMRKVDFAKAEAIEEINRWAKERTAGRIDSILEPGSNPSLVALNAFAFKDCWRIPFDPAQTSDAPFTRLDGSVIKVRTMALQNETLAHGQSGGFVGLELPYADDRFVMTLVTTAGAPAPPADFGRARDLLAGIGLKPGAVRLTLPKFDGDAEHDLLPLLAAGGLAPGLASKTQLSGFAEGLTLSAVKQKIYIRADEKGTEAAAATAAIATRSAIQASPAPISFDKPFVYALRHRATGTMLMVGYVGKPGSK